ncbi:MAG: DUF2218 domain-containing protein [Beijerinckiaceae bacterium]|nr:DUF2218 domain-containing protein [Beijerinckiaceae bacterium]
MPISRAQISTASGAKYMTQLCKHWSHRLAVEYNETTGRIAFDEERRCILHAAPDALELNVETASDEQLARTQETVVNHLKRFAFREDFGEISWRRLE